MCKGVENGSNVEQYHTFLHSFFECRSDHNRRALFEGEDDLLDRDSVSIIHALGRFCVLHQRGPGSSCHLRCKSKCVSGYASWTSIGPLAKSLRTGPRTKSERTGPLARSKETSPLAVSTAVRSAKPSGLVRSPYPSGPVRSANPSGPFRSTTPRGPHLFATPLRNSPGGHDRGWFK